MTMCIRACRRLTHRFFLVSFLSTLVLFVYFVSVYFREIVINNDNRRTLTTETGHSTRTGSQTAWITADKNRSKYDLQKDQTCIHPQLELWHPELKKYFVDVPPLKCWDGPDWVYADNGTLVISEVALRQQGRIVCDYTPYIRGTNDFVVLQGNTVKDVKNGTALASDFFSVKCTSQSGGVYKNIHSGIVPSDSVRQRRVHLADNALGLNVLMFGFDSTSRMTWMRNLPKSHEYLVHVLGATVLEGYNIVGDGTPQALLPILTGKTEQELPEARRGHFSATTVDGHPWIWKEFARQGYVTQWGEDGASVGTFTYRMLGFQNPPVDHYMRPFYIQAEKEYAHHRPYCLGATPRHLNMLNWIKQFFAMYPGRPKFSFLFHSEFTHSGYSEVRVVDDDLRDFLVYMNDSGQLNNTLLILMADHGARFQAVRQTVQGKYEERMPYFTLRFPPWFRDKYPDVMRNIQTNAQRLTTPFDIHETFLDVLGFTGATRGDARHRGISLLKEVPAERTCSQAGIEPHWCACLDWHPVADNDPRIQRALAVLIDTINSMTYSQRHLCSRLELNNVTAAVQHAPNEHLLKFKQSADADGRLADLSDDMNVSELFYQVSITTKPGLARYEATLKYTFTKDKFALSEKDISRTNKYGLDPHCVMKIYPHLRPYCYCLEQLN